MYNFPIGVISHAYKTSFEEAVAKAALMGADGIQTYFDPDLPANMRKDTIAVMKDNGLRFSAILGEFGIPLSNKETNPKAIDNLKKVMDIGLEFGCEIVTSHIGVIPNDPNHDRYKIMQEACFELSQFADSCNAHFAIETGPESSVTLKGFLDGLNSRGVGVNLDPANLVMVIGENPVDAVYNLKDYIFHTHAKDGKKYGYCDPEVVYHIIEGPVAAGKAYQEVALGQGDVDFPAYLAALDDIGYKGFLTIEREVGDTPEVDIKTAYDFLKSIINK